MGISSGDLQPNSPTSDVEPLTESLLAIGCSDKILRFFDLDTNHTMKSIRAHARGDAIVGIVSAVRPPYHASDFERGLRAEEGAGKTDEFDAAMAVTAKTYSRIGTICTAGVGYLR